MTETIVTVNTTSEKATTTPDVSTAAEHYVKNTVTKTAVMGDATSEDRKLSAVVQVPTISLGGTVTANNTAEAFM